MCQNKCQEWLPFNPNEVPEPKQDYCLILKFKGQQNVCLYHYYKGKWKDFDDLPPTHFDFKHLGLPTYKLVKL